MRWLKRLFWVIFFFWIIIAFLPKSNLFYLAENYLQKQKIIFNNEKLSDKFGIFTIKEAQVFYDGLHVGDIDKISILPTIFYNSLAIENASFTNAMKQFVPQNINALHVRHTLFYPIVAFISSSGDFGEIKGDVNFYTRKVKLVLTPQKDFATKYSAIASQFKKQEDTFIYETSF